MELNDNGTAVCQLDVCAGWFGAVLMPIGEGQSKFLGKTIGASVATSSDTYRNQAGWENGCKWGSVARLGGRYNRG
jgi:hypothetical protein